MVRWSVVSGSLAAAGRRKGRGQGGSSSFGLRGVPTNDVVGRRPALAQSSNAEAKYGEMIIKLAQATASKAPKARHIPAWGEAPWMIAQIESEGRRPDLYSPVTNKRRVSGLLLDLPEQA